MCIDKDRERLLQDHNLEWITRDLKATDMVTVYRWVGNSQDYFILCALIPPNQVEHVLSENNISSGAPENMDGMPKAFNDDIKGRKKQVIYLRYGNEDGFEPLIICHSFGGIREDYNEMSEEFCLFHNLYHDRKTGTYIKIDEAGNEKTVAIVKPNEVQIRLKEIRQFLAVKEMYLSMLFEFNEYSRYSLEELGLGDVEREFKSEGLMYWRHDYCGETRYKGFRSDSRLRGRRLIKPLPKSKSGFRDFTEEPKYVEFIVDVDENGDEVYYACDPGRLKKVSGENPDAPWDITPVHFRKQVLDKYYSEPNKYTIRDSRVSCGLWGMKIDNHDPDKVCVMLRDLGISLPYTEQLHWRANNIPPEGGMSKTFFERNVEGKWVSSDQPDILFKQSYEQLQKACDEYLDWRLLKPLGSGDEYRFRRLRVPVNDEQCHFDDLVQDLQTILIESINVKGLKKLLPEAKKADLKNKGSIKILREVFNFRSVGDADHRVSFLQKLQALRSEGSGHRKGRGYQKIANYFEVDSFGQREAFAEILKRALDTVDFFTSIVRSGKLGDKNEGGC